MMTLNSYVRTGLLVALAFSLGACLKSNPPVNTQRYSLPDASAAQPTAAQTNTLVLQRIQLADYLDTDRIVVQIDDITLHPARDHLWVDNLSQELRRGLRTRLASRLQHTAVVDPLPGAPAAPTLYLTIDQFHGQMQGYAVLSGQWRLVSASQTEMKNHTFRFSTALAENGYPALVRALGANLDQLADQLAEQVSGELAGQLATQAQPAP